MFEPATHHSGSNSVLSVHSSAQRTRNLWRVRCCSQLKLSYEWQVIGSDQRFPAAMRAKTLQQKTAVIIKVIEMKDWEDSGIRPRITQETLRLDYFKSVSH